VIQDDGGDNSEVFAPEAHDFRWSCDWLVFEPVPLRWADDASYASFQAEDLW
jgi:hypothetical protein